MTLLECLNQLPDDMIMKDLASLHGTTARVTEFRQKFTKDGGNYEIGQISSNYGKSVKTSIRVVGGGNVLIEM